MSEFKEYEEWEASLDQKYLKQLSPDAFELSPAAFYAGQQSQQAKIDNLQKENDKLNIWYKNVKLQLENKQIDCDRSDKERDELRARVDKALNMLCKLQYSSGERIYGEVGGILKGNKDES